MAMYRGADLLTPELATFIKQDVSEIAESSPIISKLANFVTGLGGKFNELYHGAGIKSINQRRPYVHIDHSGNDLAEKIASSTYFSPIAIYTTPLVCFNI